MTNFTYKAAGVDIEAGNELVKFIKPLAKRTQRPGVIGGIGGFGALFELPLDRYRQPVLVSSTDGVGTKLKLAITLHKHDTIGIDLVAMCVNDIIVQGAEPLFFLDYYATGHIELDIAKQVIQGIAEGCEIAGMSLVGGETAEMPGVYSGDDYDLAGFVVGIVEKDKIIDGSAVKAGDVLIGLASSGIHSNGYSLVRKIIDGKQIDLHTPLNGQTLGEALLAPTRIYVKSILKLLNHQAPLHALAHITGGGLTENLPRVLPKHTKAVIELDSWDKLPVFAWLQQQGNIADQEMLRTFNCGIGMVLCVPADSVKNIMAELEKLGEQAWVIGRIEKSTVENPEVEYV